MRHPRCERPLTGRYELRTDVCDNEGNESSGEGRSVREGDLFEDRARRLASPLPRYELPRDVQRGEK